MDASGSQQLLDDWDDISDSEFLNIPCEQQSIGKISCNFQCLLGAPKDCVILVICCDCHAFFFFLFICLYNISFFPLKECGMC